MIVFPAGLNPGGNTPKVFGIGLSKTGGTSLTVALRALGYQTLRYPTRPEDFSRHEALTDSSVSAVFQRLDALFPASRFVLTSRALATWLGSCRVHFSQPAQNEFARSIRRVLYGCEVYHEALFTVAHQFHSLKVQEHFKDRPEQLLILDVCGEAEVAWTKLCAFLQKPCPATPFPHKNKTRASNRS